MRHTVRPLAEGRVECSWMYVGHRPSADRVELFIRELGRKAMTNASEID
jgi:hypothetical protein